MLRSGLEMFLKYLMILEIFLEFDSFFFELDVLTWTSTWVMLVSCFSGVLWQISTRPGSFSGSSAGILLSCWAVSLAAWPGSCVRCCTLLRLSC